MNAPTKDILSKDLLDKTAQLSEEVTRPFPASKKIYVEGSRPDIRVPMREVEQTRTPIQVGPEDGQPMSLANPAITVYDTSGAYTDPDVEVDLLKGLPAVREAWILEREDTEALTGPSSEFGQARLADSELDSLRFGHLRTPRVAKAGQNVSQMHYAKQGIITPEMEYIAIRENCR